MSLPAGDILALDLATTFGWAEGGIDGTPRYGSERFAPAGADRAAVLFGVATLMLQDAQNALRMIAEGRTPDGAAHRMSELQDVAKVALDRVSMSVLEAMAIDIEALRR